MKRIRQKHRQVETLAAKQLDHLPGSLGRPPAVRLPSQKFVKIRQSVQDVGDHRSH
jgi:hypothetical protein